MKKRIAAFILAETLCLGLTACGSRSAITTPSSSESSYGSLPSSRESTFRQSEPEPPSEADAVIAPEPKDDIPLEPEEYISEESEEPFTLTYLEDDVQVDMALSLDDAEEIENELQYLSLNRPEMLIQCTSCGGSGRRSTPCEYCGGSGQRVLSEVTAFVASVPCSACRDGYPSCDDCTFGLMENPNYAEEASAWTERRHELWIQLGYSPEEIHRMEIDEAKAALNIDTNSDDFYINGNDDGFYVDETPPGICRVCSGSGKCPTCNGDRLYQNMFTGNQIVCPNCTDGLCWKCGGSKTAN